MPTVFFKRSQSQKIYGMAVTEIENNPEEWVESLATATATHLKMRGDHSTKRLNMDQKQDIVEQSPPNSVWGRWSIFDASYLKNTSIQLQEDYNDGGYREHRIVDTPYEDDYREAAIRIIVKQNSTVPDEEGLTTKYINLIKPYTKFFLTGVQSQRSETFSISQNFEDYNVFFGDGETPEIRMFNGFLLNYKVSSDSQPANIDPFDPIGTALSMRSAVEVQKRLKQNDWKTEWKWLYANYLRGSKCIKYKAKVYVTYDNVMAEGYIISTSDTLSSDIPNLCPFGFRLLITKERFLRGTLGIEEDAKAPQISTDKEALLNYDGYSLLVNQAFQITDDKGDMDGITTFEEIQ